VKVESSVIPAIATFASVMLDELRTKNHESNWFSASAFFEKIT
jgi:hypothetical protein